MRTKDQTKEHQKQRWKEKDDITNITTERKDGRKNDTKMDRTAKEINDERQKSRQDKGRKEHTMTNSMQTDNNE